MVLGLVAGHAAFNLRAPVGESIDPCCVEPIEVSPALGDDGVRPLNSALLAPVRVVRLKLSGMTCDACAARVSKALYGVRGAEYVDVSLAKAAAEVRGAATDVSAAALVEAVARTGFGATVVAEERSNGSA